MRLPVPALGCPLRTFGALRGTPTETGAFDFTIEARNADEVLSKAYTLDVVSCPVPPQDLVAIIRCVIGLSTASCVKEIDIMAMTDRV